MKGEQRTLADAIARRAIQIGARTPAIPALALMRLVTRIRLWPSELQTIARAVKRRAPCNFLVFGLGNDSPFWTALNPGGRTEFIEDVREWYERVTSRDPSITAHLVSYNTQRTQWREMLGTEAVFDLELPEAVRNTRWDVILVDAPMGWKDATPGRMKSIAAATRLAAPGADIFVHDCEREVERVYSDYYLRAENLEYAGLRLRQYKALAADNSRG